MSLRFVACAQFDYAGPTRHTLPGSVSVPYKGRRPSPTQKTYGLVFTATGLGKPVRVTKNQGNSLERVACRRPAPLTREDSS